uniref:Uncharacterized protein n=1 Tax=Anopheles farauti TaxID=69004 RepID=A0A182Q7S4_9DIPT
MGLNNRDKQTKLKTQSLLDSERTGQQTMTTVTVDHGSIALPPETLATVTGSSTSSFQQSTSSSTSARTVSSSGEQKKGGVQKFSTVSSVRSEANKSKQIDNIIEEIHHIASDTIGTTSELIGSAAGRSPTMGRSKVTQKTVLTSGGGFVGGESGRKESFTSDNVASGASVKEPGANQEVITAIGPSKIEISKMALDSSVVTSSTSSTSSSKVMHSSSSAITTKKEQSSHSSSMGHSEKIVSESSAQKAESQSSKSVHSSSSMTSSNKTALSASESFHTSALNGSDSGQVSGRQTGTVSSTVQPMRDHSTFDQKSYHLVDADGKTRQHVDTQSYSMAQSQAPTTKVVYDSAGNQITSTSSSYQAAQGHSTSSFQRSEGVDFKSSPNRAGTKEHLLDIGGNTGQDVLSHGISSGQSQAQATTFLYDGAGKQITSTSSSYQAAKGYSSSTIQSSEDVSTKSSKHVAASSSSSSTRAQNVSTSSTKDAKVIDSTTLENYSNQMDATSTGQHSNNMLMKTESAHTVTSLSSAHDSLASTIQSTQLVTESASQAEQQHQHSETIKTTETSSHYAQMNEESRSRRKTSEYREQRESNAAILKRKTYDEYGRRLNLIDEKIVPKDVVTADLQDDVTNVTKTSFEAKLFNPKLKRWELVDQKTILEKDVTTEIPLEIVKELEVERPELANITTTIQMTKVYDAKTKQWKTVDHKKHIDVLEKITFLEESSGRSELDESERTKNLKSMDMVDRVTIKEVSDLSDEKRSRVSKTSKHKDEQTVQEQCICEICTCGRHNCYNCGGSSATTQTKSSKYTTMSNSENFYHQENFSSELTQATTGRRGTWTIEDAEEHLNRSETHTTEHETTARRLTWTKEDFDKVDINKLKGDYARSKPIRHEDNLKPEGEFMVPERLQYTPGERVKPIRHGDNLKPEGNFSTPEKPQ